MKHKNRCDIQCSNFLFRTHLSDTIDKDEQQQFSMKKMTFENKKDHRDGRSHILDEFSLILLLMLLIHFENIYR